METRTPDIQAALTVIGRRPTQEDDPPLDLNQTDLRPPTGEPRKANLTRARLDQANLKGVRLRETNLTEARLDGALANCDTVWPYGWDRTRRAAAGVDEPDDEAPPAASPAG